MQPSPMAETSSLPFPSLRFCMSILLCCVNGGRSGQVLLVADLFEPVHDLAVERFLNRDMGHGRGRRRAVPMLLAGRAQDHVAWPDLLLGFAPTLGPAAPGCHDQRLAKRMGVPGRAR